MTDGTNRPAGEDPSLDPTADPTATIERALIALVRRANDPRGNEVLNRLAGVDIERAAAVMLYRLRELEPARVSALAEAAAVDLSAASRQVARLVERGLVERRDDPTDGRAAVHVLSAEGRDITRRLLEARRTWLEGLLSELSQEEQATLARLLDHFVDRLLAS